MKKTFQFLTAGNKWNNLKKGEYKVKQESGRPVRILHENGSYFVIANKEALPEGIEPKARAEKPKAEVQVEATA
jgi:hypothetical protein|tara:strand:+ start:282 stop:503 length:222 start_codon:yes stop_codon:yes gene_type:complete